MIPRSTRSDTKREIILRTGPDAIAVPALDEAKESLPLLLACFNIERMPVVVIVVVMVVVMVVAIVVVVIVVAVVRLVGGVVVVVGSDGVGEC